MKNKTLSIILMVGILLVSAVIAEVSAVSDDTSLDTRTLSNLVEMEAQDLDTRSFTTDLSDIAPLNTKKIVGTLLILQ